VVGIPSSTKVNSIKEGHVVHEGDNVKRPATTKEEEENKENWEYSPVLL
jgi:hypothetical protein